MYTVELKLSWKLEIFFKRYSFLIMILIFFKARKYLNYEVCVGFIPHERPTKSSQEMNSLSVGKPDHRWHSPYKRAIYVKRRGNFFTQFRYVCHQPSEQYNWASLHAHLYRSPWCRGNWPHVSPREMAELLCAILRIVSNFYKK